jgi:hypothetical protein
MHFLLKTKPQALFLLLVSASLTPISTTPPETTGTFRFVTQSTTVGCSTGALNIVAVSLFISAGSNAIRFSSPTSTSVVGCKCKNFNPRIALNYHPFGGMSGNILAQA